MAISIHEEAGWRMAPLVSVLPIRPSSTSQSHALDGLPVAVDETLSSLFRLGEAYCAGLVPLSCMQDPGQR